MFRKNLFKSRMGLMDKVFAHTLLHKILPPEKKKWKSHSSIISKIKKKKDEEAGRLSESQILLCVTALGVFPFTTCHIHCFLPSGQKSTGTTILVPAVERLTHVVTYSPQMQPCSTLSTAESQHKQSLPMKTEGSPPRSQVRILGSGDETLFTLEVIVRKTSLSVQRSQMQDWVTSLLRTQVKLCLTSRGGQMRNHTQMETRGGRARRQL